MLDNTAGAVLAVLLCVFYSRTQGQILTINVQAPTTNLCQPTGLCKLNQCDPGETEVNTGTCSLYSNYYSGIYGYAITYKQCVTSTPCCSLPAATCRSQCGSSETQFPSFWTCPTAGQVCCAANSLAVTTTTRATTTTTRPTTTTTLAPTVANRQGACGSSAVLSSRIFGGAVAGATDWPWMVRITYTTTSGFCAGVLVDADTVVTPAHCVAGVNRASMQVILADYDTSRFDTGEEVVGVASYFLDSGFRRGTRGRDFAVIKLARNVTYTARKLPVCLYDPAIPLVSPRSCYIAGWGVTATGVGGPIRSANVQLLDWTTCQGRVGPTLPTDIICTHNPASSPTDGCLFDDGDMLVCRDTRDRWALMGIMSEYSCGQGLPVLFTNMSVYTSVTLSQL